MRATTGIWLARPEAPGNGTNRVAPRHLAGAGLDLLLALVGVLLSVSAYQSIFPTAACVLMFGTSGSVIAVGFGIQSWEWRMFRRLFSLGWVACGFAGVFAEHLQDEYQIASDASSFFELSIGAAEQLTVDEIGSISDGSLMVYVWRTTYDAFASIGFPRERYIGVLVNVLLVALSGVIAIRIVRQINGVDASRMCRLVLTMSCSGMLWLFAGLHLRDSAVFLLVTGSVAVWVWYLGQPRMDIRLVLAGAASAVLSILLQVLRAEFLLVPFALGMAALVSATLAQGNPLWRVSLLVLGTLLTGSFFLVAESDIGYFLDRSAIGYLELATAESSRDSLGMRFVVGQPVPIRALVGSPYLILSPIPFWSGFKTNSAYLWFKSFNVVFFYFVVPLLALGVRATWIDKKSRTAQCLFLISVFIGVTVLVSVTSLETRHLHAFLVPILVLAIQPDLARWDVRRTYLRLLFLLLAGITAGHILWAVLKL